MIKDNFPKCKEFNAIKRIYEDNKKDSFLLDSVLMNNPELLSFKNNNNIIYNKIFLIMCANAFEKRITKILPSLLSGEIKGNAVNQGIFETTSEKIITLFFKKTAFNKGFHTLFEWEADKNKQNNSNKFLALFGEGYKGIFRKKIDENPTVREGEKSFIILGRYRNLLVHNGIYEQNLPSEMDLGLIYTHFNRAIDFCCFLFEEVELSIFET